eukprot:CAMPEP_0184006450 /NCGR_PEP_ID=MMETSP0954-20121128/700_1 /TAXON_ID=627963 /ORGANISM="Aplanochytrium sp, Strain PBS07" /LENGTH=350 /DNA_ID=CAMNT_0026285001 /DNA_START=1 /DNA_END=1050 /DNA_ORIENTATION=+
MVEAFPRGGRLKSEEKKRKSRDLEQQGAIGSDDNLFKAVVKKRKTPKKKKTEILTGLTSGKKRSRVEVERSSKKDDPVFKLRFKDLKKGHLVLGVVKQIGDFHGVISLASNLNGIVSIERVSDVKPAKKRMENYLRVGDYVRCLIHSVSRQDDGNPRIELSLKASEVNENLDIDDIKRGCFVFGNIRSREDHGYIVSLGIGNISGFLSFENISSSSESDSFKIGQPIHAKVLNNRSPFKLTMEKAQLDKPVSEGVKSAACLQPGVLVEVKVKKVLNNGLKVSCMDGFMGTVELAHLETIATPDWGSAYEGAESKTKKRLARIIYFDPDTKKVAFSLSPHIIYYQKMSSSF